MSFDVKMPRSENRMVKPRDVAAKSALRTSYMEKYAGNNRRRKLGEKPLRNAEKRSPTIGRLRRRAFYFCITSSPISVTSDLFVRLPN